MFKVKKDKTICVCMIVKNESHVIGRCMRSFAPLADYYVICDTGSTDDTIEIIKKTGEEVGLKGEVLEHPWVNFAHNRSLSLKAGRSKADFLLVIDADEVIKYRVGDKYYEIEDIKEDPKITLPSLEKDCYNILSELGSITYDRLQLMNNKLEWRYESVVHEYAIADNITSIDRLTEFMNMPRVEGARSKDPNKYYKDALALEKGLLDEPHNSRYYFYLAQSYRDAGMWKESRDNYLKRIKMEGYDEELNVCYHQIGHCSKMLGEKIDTYGHYYLEGYHRFQHRLECFYEYIRELRLSGKPFLGYTFGYHALMTPFPKNDHLFILKDIYNYLFKLEMALCCIELKKLNEALILLKYILDHNAKDIPEDKCGEIQRLLINVSGTMGKRIESLDQIKIKYNLEDIKSSEVTIDLIKYNVVLIGPAQKTNEVYRELAKIKGIKVEKRNSIKLEDMNDDTLYINTTKGTSNRWNEIYVQKAEDSKFLSLLLDLDKQSCKKYLDTFGNDLQFTNNYRNLCNGDVDIILLGEPTTDKLRKISSIMTPINRLVLVNWDNPNRSPESGALLNGIRHLSVGNVGGSPLKDNLVKLLDAVGIKDAKVGWMELIDPRLVCLVQNVVNNQNQKLLKTKVI